MRNFWLLAPPAGAGLMLAALAAAVLLMLGGLSPVLARECGGASWYGPGFHGKRAASGEIYNQNAMTAAHRTLAFGTVVDVVDRRTGRSVAVRINDRGPFVKGRIIDLSRAAATRLGTRAAGVAPVCLRVRR